MSPARCDWREIFAVDLRSLALFRIGLAVCVLADLATRALDIGGLYTDAGAYPASLQLERQGRVAYLSAHYWASAHPLLQAGLFAASAGVAGLLAAGKHTRLATLGCWYLVSSLQARNPLVYIGGDSILRLLLFWAMFLPLGARFSLDARGSASTSRPDRFTSGASAALLLQVALIYWVTGLQKSGELWWSGQAVAYALQADEWATPLGVFLRGQPALLEALTWSTLAIELLAPFLAFVPARSGAPRLAAVALFWSFHLGLAACMDIGLFPLFSLAAWLPFLPASFWRGQRAAGADPRARLAHGSRVVSFAALAVFAYVLVFLAELLGAPRVIPGPLRAVGRLLRLEQSWAMFAPDPPRVTRHFAWRVQFADGEQSRLAEDGALRWMLFVRRSLAADRFAGRTQGALLAYQCALRGSDTRAGHATRIGLLRTERGLDPGAPRGEEQLVAVLDCPGSSRP